MDRIGIAGSNINTSSVLWHIASTIHTDLKIFGTEAWIQYKLKLLNNGTHLIYIFFCILIQVLIF